MKKMKNINSICGKSKMEYLKRSAEKGVWVIQPLAFISALDPHIQPPAPSPQSPAPGPNKI